MNLAKYFLCYLVILFCIVLCANAYRIVGILSDGNFKIRLVQEFLQCCFCEIQKYSINDDKAIGCKIVID